MSPVSLISSSATSSGSSPLSQSLVNSTWTPNPLPDFFKEEDIRTHFLQANNNLYIEMHPEGVRGINVSTKYCLLSMIMLAFVPTGKDQDQLNGSPSSSLGKVGWDPSQSQERGLIHRNDTRAKIVIWSNVTSLFLCMDNSSVVYQSKNLSFPECAFYNEPDVYYRNERFYRQVNTTSEKWYLSLNKDGTIKCGNVTKSTDEGALFKRTDIEGRKLHESPNFNKKDKKCCLRKRCKTRRKKTCKRARRCRRLRRKFFKLSLKELKRYFKKCVQNKKRHCRKKKS